MIDCHSRRLVGRAIADHMRTSLITDALTAAGPPAAPFHADHGSQYTSWDLADL